VHTRVFAAVTVVAVFSIGAMSDSWACSCAQSLLTRSEHVPKYEAVFVGRVVDIRQKNTFPHEVTVEVQIGWKGISTTEVKLSNADEGMCGFPFVEGKTYLIFAVRLTDGSLSTHLCSPTQELSALEDILESLGEPNYRAR
jgi:hypothetical protein